MTNDLSGGAGPSGKGQEMAAPNLKAGAGTLPQAAKMTGEAYEDFQAMANQLSNRLDSYIAGWQGAGSTAFVQLHDSWQQHHTKIANLLQELQSVFMKTSSSFDDTDAAAHSSITSVSNDLNTRLG